MVARSASRQQPPRRASWLRSQSPCLPLLNFCRHPAMNNFQGFTKTSGDDRQSLPLALADFAGVVEHVANGVDCVQAVVQCREIKPLSESDLLLGSDDLNRADFRLRCC